METNSSFFNKTAIVTGAGQGIGLKICEMLASEGARVILNDVDEALKEKLGGGALDEDQEEAHNGISGPLPISGGEAGALPEAVAAVIAKAGSDEDDNKD